MATEEKKPAEGDKAAEQKPAAAATPVTPEEVATKSRKRRLMMMIIVGAVVVLGIGGGAAFFLGKSGVKHPEEAATTEAGHGDDHAAEKADGHGVEKPKDDHAAKKDGHGTEKSGEKKDAKGGDTLAAKVVDGVEFGATLPLKTFHLNLGNPLENHYLRLEIAIEYKGGDAQKTEIEQRMPQLRDAVVSVASRKSREFLLGPDGKEQLRHELKVRLNRYMNKPVESVYITDMLIE